MFNNICVACKESFIAWRKTQEICSKCILDMRAIMARVKAGNKYIKDPNGKTNFHRTISEMVMGRKLATDEVVHHMDCNYLNNSLDNLMIMSNRSHASLHKYLDKQHLILEKSMGCNSNSRWNEIVVPITMEWIKATNTKAIVVSEINPNKNINDFLDNLQLRINSKRVAKNSKNTKPRIIKNKSVVFKNRVCECGNIFKVKDTSSKKYCSTHCARKFDRKFEIETKDLEALVWSKPTVEVAKLLGVSDVAVSKRCKLLGITKPPRGFWGKVKAGLLIADGLPK